MNRIIVLVVYLALLNVIGFIVMGVDKRKAVKHKWRIPEKTLFLVAILGGSLGGIFGMQLFRHKTKHTHFIIGFPAIFIIQVLIITYLW